MSAAAQVRSPTTRVTLAGVEAVQVGQRTASGGLLVVILHGFGMEPEDLSPFAHSLSVPGVFLFPRGPVEISAQATGRAGPARAFWPIDTVARTAAIARGTPRDLAAEHPPALPAARELLLRFVQEARSQFAPQRLVLGGFSQGAMLALDTVLREDLPVSALLLFSASRLALSEWQPRLPRLAGLPILQSHGRADPDLAFSAAEKLNLALNEAGASLTWVPFEGGHEIPFPVWRQVRRFLGDHAPAE